MLCVLIFLYIRGGTYSLKSTPNEKFSEKLFMAILFTLSVFARGNRRRNNFRISFWCLPTRPRRLHVKMLMRQQICISDRHSAEITVLLQGTYFLEWLLAILFEGYWVSYAFSPYPLFSPLHQVTHPQSFKLPPTCLIVCFTWYFELFHAVGANNTPFRLIEIG